MIEFGREALKLSVGVARALLAFACEDSTRSTIAGVGIDDGDVCATDGHTAVRFEKVTIEDGAPPPTRWNGRIFPRSKVEARLQARGKSSVIELPWLEFEQGPFAQLHKVEPQNYVRDDDLPIAWDSSYLGRLELVAKACRRERVPGEQSAPMLPPAMLVSLGSAHDPCRYEIGGEHWTTAAHTAFVTIMPVRTRGKGANGDEGVIREAKDRLEARKQAAEAKRARREQQQVGRLPENLSGAVEDEAARVELARLSAVKLATLWTNRPAQRQVLSNVLRGREVTREQRASIAARMKLRPLSDLRYVVATELGTGEAKPRVSEPVELDGQDCAVLGLGAADVGKGVAA